MKRLEPVSKIMTKKLVTLTLKDDLFTAEKLFKECHIRHIPIVKENHIIGMLGLTDLDRISFLDAYDANEIQIDNAIYNMLSIEQVMVKNVVKIKPIEVEKRIDEIFSDLIADVKGNDEGFIQYLNEKTFSFSKVTRVKTIWPNSDWMTTRLGEGIK